MGRKGPPYVPYVPYIPYVPYSLFLSRERIGAELKLEDLARGSLAAFHVEWSAGANGRPETATFPAAVRVVNTAIEPFGVKS